MEACSVCGTSLAPAETLYTTDAKVVCSGCNAQADLVDTDKRAARNIVRAAWSAFGLGAASMFGPFAYIGWLTYLIVAMAWISAGFAVQSLARGGDNDRFTKYLSATQRTMVWVLSALGFGLGVFTALGYPAQLAFWLMAKT